MSLPARCCGAHIARFTAGHFTVFSAAARETLHGHDYTVRVSGLCRRQEAGGESPCAEMAAPCAEIDRICAQWHDRMLVPRDSPYLRVTEEVRVPASRAGSRGPAASPPTISMQGPLVVAEHAGEELRFDRSLVELLPVPNVTGESLAALLADRCLSVLGSGAAVRSVGAAWLCLWLAC